MPAVTAPVAAILHACLNTDARDRRDETPVFVAEGVCVCVFPALEHSLCEVEMLSVLLQWLVGNIERNVNKSEWQKNPGEFLFTCGMCAYMTYSC